MWENVASVAYWNYEKEKYFYCPEACKIKTFLVAKIEKFEIKN